MRAPSSSRPPLLRSPRLIWWIVFALVVSVESASAEKISELITTDLFEQARRFLSFRDPAVRYALMGSVLLGVSCGLLGSFIVVRKMALVGDTLSHAVLPGVALGFLWNMNKDPLAILIGATAAGLLGAAVVQWIKHTTRLKEDTALGIVLGGFFGVGTCLLTMIQHLPSGNKSGIDKFLFGQAAAISVADIQLMSVTTIASVIIVTLLYKEFLSVSFDSGFAHAIGLPVRLLHHTLMLLLAFAVVVSLQAVGVVLVSAMLITPAATAYLLTERMHRMVYLAAIVGMFSGILGAFLSFLGPTLPTGPFMVLAASFLFGLAFLFAPKHGVVTRWFRRRSSVVRVRNENTLKSIYHVLEAREFKGDAVSMRELAERRRETLEEIGRQAGALRRHGLATLNAQRDVLFLTPPGWERACEIVRNHRLWELYLTHAADMPADHVHDDAEKIEHVIGEETVRELERKLSFATTDPHGRAIPTFEDMQKGLSRTRPGKMTGYGKR